MIDPAADLAEQAGGCHRICGVAHVILIVAMPGNTMSRRVARAGSTVVHLGGGECAAKGVAELGRPFRVKVEFEIKI